MQRRTRVVALVASVALLAAGGTVAVLTAPRPACATTGQVLGVVPGERFDAVGRLPERAVRAIRVIRRSGGYEGVWAAGGQVLIGVHGPAWSGTRAAAAAVADVPGPRITYVCEPTTEHALLATQEALGRSGPWTGSVIGSGIDVRTAKVTVALAERAPAGTEDRMRAQLGPDLRITRSRDAGVDLRPATGRMPLASDHAE